MRERIREFLASEHEVLGAFEDCESLVEAVDQFRPELVILDISIPIMGGFLAAEHIRENSPSIKIVFVTQHSERAYVERAMLLGASAYVLKRDMVTDLMGAIREASTGHTFISPRLRAEPRRNVTLL
ncbi:MAG: response regulator transcription factor [Acidobacteriaceae bacterium]|nr:response regulator transcription factor [Acidobacteriaceae bacterium]